MPDKAIKSLPVKASVYDQIAEYAETRGYSIQGLTERILRKWLNEVQSRPAEK